MKRQILLFFTLISVCVAVAAPQSNGTGSQAHAVTPGGETDPAISTSADTSAGPDSGDLRTRTLIRMPEIIGDPKEMQPSFMDPPMAAESFVAPPPVPKPQFETRRALRQELEYLSVEHGFRLMQDPVLRNQVAHAPFFHNWFVSFKGYDLKRWGDGDDFLVNDIAHPMQGAVAGWIFLQNSPTGSTAVIGKDPQYWTSRLKATAWAAAFEVQWKIGPLSESSIGNAGGWIYVPDCGSQLKCANNPAYKPPTNNTGLSDWIMTPIGGLGWIIIEDTIDKYIAAKVGEHNWVAGNILRSALEPTRNFAALFNGVVPWERRYGERRFIHPVSKPIGSGSAEDSWRNNRKSAGVSFVTVSLPGEPNSCVRCRQNYPGVSFPYSFRMFEHVYFDGEISHFPSNSHGGPAWEGLFGAKFGEQASKWGLFATIRPGFIYYQKAWSGGTNPHFTDLSRFALNAGGALELYPNRRSTIRFDCGTTLVRYLQDYANPNVSQLGSFLSTDYYVTQGNFQFSTGYRIRF